jgi:hypothetical protein
VRRVGPHVDGAELGSETPNEVGTELLVVGRPVLDGDHLVVEVVDVLLIGARQGMERALGLSPHVVEDDHDRQVLGLGRRRRGKGRMGARRCRRRLEIGLAPRDPRLLGLAPEGSRPVDPLDRVIDPPAGAELVDDLLGLGRAVVLDDHEAADVDLVVQGIEDVGGRLVEVVAETEQRHALERRFRERVAVLALQETQAVVVEIEPLERVAHRVEVGT